MICGIETASFRGLVAVAGGDQIFGNGECNASTAVEIGACAQFGLNEFKLTEGVGGGEGTVGIELMEGDGVAGVGCVEGVTGGDGVASGHVGRGLPSGQAACADGGIA